MRLMRDGVNLEVNQGQRLDLKLEVGATAETVQVTAETPLVARESASLGAVIGNSQLVNASFNGRSAVQLAGLVPGVVLGRVFNDDSFNGVNNNNINAGRTSQSEIPSDGISA